MGTRIINFLEAIAPLAKTPINLENVLIISFLESYWNQKKNIQVNDIIDGISNLSASTVHRRLRKFRETKVLIHISTEQDNRIKYIEKGPQYENFLNQIVKLYDDKFIRQEL